jgi:hypothetical protein
MKAPFQNATLLLATVVLAALGMLRPVAAEPITYIYEGTGSGAIGPATFTNAAFKITALADTDNVALWSEVGDAIQNTHLSTFVAITGHGSYTILTPSHTWGANGLFGLDWAGLGQALDVNWITLDENSLDAYDLATPVGPIPETDPLHVDQFRDVLTTGGLLTFTSINEVTFTAIIPEPGTLGLVGMALVAWVRLAPHPRRHRRGTVA